MNMPFPATSPRHTSHASLLRPFPVVTKYPQKMNELKVFQQKSQAGAWLVTTKSPAHERCETPLFPFHSIPKRILGEDKEANAASGFGTQSDGGDDLSLASLPSSFSPFLPLPTSNPLNTASPYIDQRDSLSSDPHVNCHLNASYTGNSSGVEATLQLNGPSGVATSSLLLQDISLGSHEYLGRRQFCACRDPCSGHGLAPSTQGMSTSGRCGLKHTSSTDVGNPEDQLARCHNFGTGPFTDTLFGVPRERLLDNPQLNKLDLIVSASHPRSDLCTRNSWAPPIPGFAPRTDKTVVHSTLFFQHPETYDTWVSSWRFQPSAQNAAASCDLVTPSFKSHVSLPSCTPLPGQSPLQVPVAERNQVGESVLDGLGLLPPSSSLTVRNSCVLSGVNKLKSFRELLAILDDTMIKSGVATEPGDGEKENLPQPESEVVIPGLAL